MAIPSRKVAIAVGAGYAASSLLARANFTSSKPHEVYFGVNAASIAALALLRSRGLLSTAVRVSFVLRALTLVVFSAMKRPDLNAFDAMTRWDGIASAVGVSLVVAALFRAFLPGSRMRWAYELAFMLAIIPLIAVLPKLFGLPKVHRPTLVRTAELCKLVSHTTPGDIYDDKTDTSVVFVDEILADARTLFVAFNGTRGAVNMATDANIASKNIGSWLASWKGGAEPRVHAGFGSALGTVRARVLQRVLDFSAGATDAEKRRVVFTGHSLGGALATISGLFAADAMMTGGGRVVPVEVYTFGSPAAGDGTFVGLFNKAVSNSVRVVEPLDPVPRGSVTQFAHVRGYYPVSTARRDNLSQHRIETYQSAIGGGAVNTVAGFLIPAAIAFAAVVPVVGADVWLHRRSLAKSVAAVVSG